MIESKGTYVTEVTRRRLPERRASWTQKVHIIDRTQGSSTFYLTFGLYEDGTLGEVWIDAAKEGTFLRGVLGSLARMISLSLQCGVELKEIVKILRAIDYPPQGKVEGSEVVKECTSISDWIAQELEAYYLIESK